MKTKHLAVAMCVLFNVVITLQTMNAQNPVVAGQSETTLTGSTQKSEEITAKANVVVFIGKIIELGDPVPASTDTASYSGVQVKVLQVLRGTMDGDMVKVTLRTTWGRDVHESPPLIGSTYIFFVRKNTEKGWNPYTVLKLFLATDAATAKVQKMLPAAK